MKIIGDGGHASVVREILEHFDERPDGYVFIAVGNNMDRKKEAELWDGSRFTRIVSRDATVSPSAVIGEGTVVMPGAIVAARATVGKHCIINHGAVVDHDCVIEDYVHIAPGAHLCGNVHVGEGALVGVCVGVAPGYKIPSWSLVKARSLEIVALQGN